MKVGIVGVGAVGTACARSMLERGSCRELVLLDKDEARARGVAEDLSHGALLCPPMRIQAGGYSELAGFDLVLITAGINEKAGKAIDRASSLGRLLLLPKNAEIYREILAELVLAEPDAPILVVTDPPDALADVARELAARKGFDVESFRPEVASAVKHANIEIIEGTGASQHGIGIVTARIVEAMLRDEALVEPIGTLHPRYGVTLSLPSVIGRGGVRDVLEPELSREESDLLDASAKAISDALRAVQR